MTNSENRLKCPKTLVALRNENSMHAVKSLFERTPAGTIYATSRWQRIRKMVLRRDAHMCVKCGQRANLEVDHIRALPPLGDGDNSLENLQTLCAACHSRKTQIDKKKGSRSL